MGPKEVDEVEDNNKKVIDKLNQEVQELKKQHRKEKCLIAFGTQKKVDQLCADMKLDEEN